MGCEDLRSLKNLGRRGLILSRAWVIGITTMTRVVEEPVSFSQLGKWSHSLKQVR